MFLPGTEFYWDDPRKVGSKVTASDGSFYYRGPGYGTSTFIAHSRLRSRNFIKGDDASFLFSLEGAETDTALSARLHAPRWVNVHVFWSSDISALLVTQPPARSAVHVDGGPMEAAAQQAPRGSAQHSVAVAAVTGCAAAVAVAVLLVLIFRRTRTRQQESDQAVIIRDMPGFMEVSSDLYYSACGNSMCIFEPLSFV